MKHPLNLLYNFHWVVEGSVARSAQPYLGLWRYFLTINGIGAIVNLRGAHPEWGWWRAETAACERLGIGHFDLAFNSRRLPIRDKLLTMIAHFDAAPKPMLIKCSGGQDRTSLACALYLIHSEGWEAYDKAALQFSRFPYLHFPKPPQRWLRLFIEHAREDARGAPLADWLRESYDREKLAGWLEAHGHASSFERFRRDRPRALSDR